MTEGLAGLDLLTSYHRGEDDIAEQFYLPAMRRATRYDRAVGFFRSAAFIISWPALRDFVARGGRMRVLCSQVLSPDDIGALDEGYAARVDTLVAARLRAEVAGLLADPEMGQPARILAALVAAGVIEFKVAIWRPSDDGPLSRIFHDKLGFFRDDEGAVVMFKGSMNETWMGLSADGNLESVDVALSWFDGRERERVEREDGYFGRIWGGRYPGLNVRPFPETAHEDLVRAADPDWEGTVERMLREAAPAAPEPEGDQDPMRLGRPIMDHQTDGLATWRENGRRGILAFATGAGKTFTALIAAEEAITRHGEVPVIVVPDTTLFDQWLEQTVPFAARLGARLLRVGADNNRWRDQLRPWTSPGPDRRIVLATLPTARSDDFRRRLAGGSHLFLIGDEVHRMGSPASQALLDEKVFGPRLGLSATPERAGDPQGTAAILDFFGGVIEPRFSLADAIAKDVLTPYIYRPHRVELSESEAEEWREVSRRVARAIFAGGETADGIPRSAQMLLFERARIVKAAAAKVPLAVEVLRAEYRAGQRWIVYCDSEVQLAEVRAALREAGFNPRAYTSAMPADRDATIAWFTQVAGGILVAIRCFDEGVDIPGITHALILASSKNPREFIQRRGRVLRTAPGKTLAYVHDAIAVPPPQDGEDAGPDPITAGELARALQFAQGAFNKSAATSDLLDIAIDAGADWQTMFSAGVEDEDND